MASQPNLQQSNGRQLQSASPFSQPNLFDGKTFSPARDQSRLDSQLGKVFALMSDGKWRTLAEIVRQIGWQGSEAGVSARLRDLRKPRFGGHVVNRRHVENGMFEYQLRVGQ